ncbi:MAG: pilin [Candidatus Magasanikbacteria bacterium]
MYLLTKLAKYKTVMMVMATLVIGIILVPSFATAQSATDTFGIGYASDTGLGSEDIRDTISKIINVSLGLLGIVAVVIVLWGGFRWMTAGGNEEKVGEARKIIFSGVIGLAIILSAYAIAKFVLNQLGIATGVPGYEVFE